MTQQQPPLASVHALSYDATSSENLRPVVRIIGWACIALGTFMSVASGIGIHSEVHNLLLPVIVSKWRELLGPTLVITSCPVILVGGIQALRFSRIARAWMIVGMVMFIFAHIVSTAMFDWLVWNLAQDSGFMVSNVMWLLATLIFPVSLIALVTRSAIRRAF